MGTAVDVATQGQAQFYGKFDGFFVEPRQSTRMRQADRAEQEKKSATAEKAKADKEERCRKMKTSVDEMQSGFRLYDYDKSGQRYYLDEQQVAKARADAKSAYAKECQ